MILSLIAATALAKLEPQGEADLRCMAVFAVSASSEAEPDAGSIGAILYYLGRLEGRDPKFSFQTYLVELLASPKYTVESVEADAKRCGAEMQDRAARLEVVGKLMQGDGKGSH